MGRQRRYYDPGVTPYPRRMHMSASELAGLPTGSSRPQRRARARLPFKEQLGLAYKMGFPIPKEAEVAQLTAMGEGKWIASWEERYAQQ